MTRIVAVVVAFLFAASVVWLADVTAQQQQQPPKPAAPAAGAPAKGLEVEGKVKTWDKATSMVTLEDGTQIMIPATVKGADQLKEGATIKASYEEKEGKKVAKTIEVK